MWLELDEVVYNMDHVVRIEEYVDGNAVLKCDDNCRYGTNVPYKKLKRMLIPGHQVTDNVAERLRKREEFFKEK